MKKMEMAIHEAGQVVMTMLWGVWRVDRVSIVGRGKTGEGIEYVCLTEAERNDLSKRWSTRLLDAKLELMMAGPVARAILCGSEVVYRQGKGTTEFDGIVGAIRDGSAGSSLTEAWAVIHEHEPVVQADLKRMWPVVEALAKELVCRKILSDHEIRSIVRTAVNQLPENERIWAISRLRNTPPG